MSELKACPVCNKPAERFMGYDNGKVGCKNQECNYRNRPQYPDDWNNRPHEDKLKTEAVESYHRELLAATKFIFHPHFEGVKTVWLNKIERGEF